MHADPTASADQQAAFTADQLDTTSTQSPERPSRDDPGHRPGPVRAGVLIAAGVVMAAVVLAASVPAFLAEAAPGRALQLGVPSAKALLNIADQMLLDLVLDEERAVAKPDEAAAALNNKPARLASIRALAERALVKAPLNARALRMLGQVEIATGDRAKATRFMTAATEQSIRETIAVSWMFERSLDQRDLAGSLKYADIALRTVTQMAPVVAPVLARIAQTKDGNREIKRLLDGNPPWRSQFLNALPSAVTDLRTPLDILLHLKETANPPTHTQLRIYLDVLLAKRQYNLAYYTWLQFLPPEQLGSLGLLFNGTFSVPATGLPFDWQIAPGAGVTVQIANRDDQPSGNALRILFSQGRATFNGVSQLTMLSPGTYRFEGKFKGELAGRRGLQWKVSCQDTPAAALGASQTFNGVSKAWSTFNFTFTVPAGCTAQTVLLFLDARSESEKLLTGVAWYNELSIRRVDDVAAR